MLALGGWARYTRTGAPTVTVDDTGDFCLAAHFLGAAHPPGYPVFVLLGRLFYLLPLGSSAFRVNLLAAALGVLAVVLLYLFVEELGVVSPGLPAMISPAMAALLLAGSRTFWRLSTYAEVATASTAVTLGLLILLCRWRRLQNLRYLAAAAFLLGISFGVHYLCSLTAGTFAVFVLAAAYCDTWKHTQGGFLIKTVRSAAGIIGKHRLHAVAGVLLFILGSSVFLVLPLRSAHNPQHNWGEPRTCASFKQVVKRSQYADKATFDSGTRLARSFTRFLWLFKGFRDQLGEPLPVTMVIGAVCLMLLGALFLVVRDRLLGAAVIGTAILPWIALSWVLDIVLSPLRFFYVKVFMVTSFALLFALTGAGAAYIIMIIQAVSRRFAGGGESSGARASVITYILAAILLVYPAAVLCGNFTVSSRRDNLSYYDIALSSLELLPDNALLLVRGDPYTFCTWYVQCALNRHNEKPVLNTRMVHLGWYRREVKKRHPVLGKILEPVYRQTIKRGEEAWKTPLVHTWLKAGGAVFSVFNDELSPKQWSLEPWGGMYRVHPAARPFKVSETSRAGVYLWERFRVRGLRNWPSGARMNDAELALHVANSRYNTGTACFAAKRFRQAAAHFEEAVRLNPSRADSRVNLGSALYMLKRLEKALEAFEEAVACDPLLVVGWQNLIVLQTLQKNEMKTREAAVRAVEALSGHPDRLESLVGALDSLGHTGSAGFIRSLAREKESTRE